MRPLIWVSKSLEKLAAALTEMGHPIGPDTVRKELVKLGFSHQSNRKAEARRQGTVGSCNHIEAACHRRTRSGGEMGDRTVETGFRGSADACRCRSSVRSGSELSMGQQWNLCLRVRTLVPDHEVGQLQQ
jgi:hypothetical protein